MIIVCIISRCVNSFGVSRCMISGIYRGQVHFEICSHHTSSQGAEGRSFR
ncbi:hypothetical protein ACHAXM_007492 [Skeletonema potamos]